MCEVAVDLLSMLMLMFIKRYLVSPHRRSSVKKTFVLIQIKYSLLAKFYPAMAERPLAFFCCMSVGRIQLLPIVWKN